MFCSKCGTQLDNTAKFCASCGTPVETPITNITPQSEQVDRQAQWNSQWSAPAKPPAYNTSPISTPTKKKLQWWHILLIVLGGLILLISIIVGGHMNQQNEFFNKEPSNALLSSYEEHGEWSEGYVWVVKTESSYDKAEMKSFAYMNEKGDIVSKWFDYEKYIPHDFKNQHVYIEERDYYGPGFAHGGKDSIRCIYYDSDFNTIIDIYADKDYTNDAHTQSDVLITDFDENGLAYAVGEKNGVYGFYAISDNNITKLNIDDDRADSMSLDGLLKTKYENEKYVIDNRASLNIPLYSCVLDKSGNVIFEPSEDVGYKVFDIDVKTDGNYNILFMGKDDKYYRVDIDSSGNFINEPKSE